MIPSLLVLLHLSIPVDCASTAKRLYEAGDRCREMGYAEGRACRRPLPGLWTDWGAMCLTKPSDWPGR